MACLDTSFLNELIHAKRGVTPDPELRLERLFGMEAQFWLFGATAWGTSCEGMPANSVSRYECERVAKQRVRRSHSPTGPSSRPGSRWPRSPGSSVWPPRLSLGRRVEREGSKSTWETTSPFIIADGSGSTGYWKVSPSRRADRVAIHRQSVRAGQRLNELFTALHDGVIGPTKKNRRYTVRLRDIQHAGTTDRNWPDFADTRSNPVRYISRQ